MAEVAEVNGRLELPSATLFVRAWTRPGGDADPPLIFVHHLGISGSSLHLAEVAPLLAAGYRLRVLAPDLPGFGGSEALPDPDAYRPDALARLLLELVDRLDLPPVAYVGSSWGATVGCHLVALAPERVRALVLLDAGHVDAADQPGFDPRASLPDRVKAAAGRLGGFRFRRLDDALDTVSNDYPRWTPELEASWRAGLHVVDHRVRPRLRPEVYAAAVHGLAVAPPSPTWPAIAAAGTPVLLITADEPGEGGERQARARARFAAAVPRAEVRVAQGHRHDLVAGLGPLLAAEVGDWLRSVGADR